MTLFESAIRLARELPELPDQRPAWLRSLRDAEHPTCPYYLFLYELSRRNPGTSVLEIGTFVGTSAAHLAAHASTVVTIDINPDAKRRTDELQLSNVTAMTGNSLALFDDFVASNKTWDLVFVDGNHTFNQAYAEYSLYRQLVRDGGLLLFDDVALEMNGDEMEVFWRFVSEHKVRADHLHTTTGFGIVEKQDVIVVPELSQIGQAAWLEIERRRGT